MDTSINRIPPDPGRQSAIRRVGRPQRDGDQTQDSFSETLGEEEHQADEPSGSSEDNVPKGNGEEGIGGQLDVVG